MLNKPAYTVRIWKLWDFPVHIYFSATPDTSATWFWFWHSFLLLAVVSVLIQFEDEGMSRTGWNIYTVASILAWFVLIRTRQNAARNLDRARQIQGVSVVALLTRCSVLTSVVTESNGLVKAVLTHSHLTRAGQAGGQKWSVLWWMCHNERMRLSNISQWLKVFPARPVTFNSTLHFYSSPPLAVFYYFVLQKA